MKKVFCFFLAFILLFSLVACSKANNSDEQAEQAAAVEATPENVTAVEEEQEEEITEEPTTLRVFMLAGPTGIGAANMIAGNDEGKYEQSYEFTIATAPDEVVGKIIKGEADIAAIPTNLASVLYSKTDGDITVLGVNTLGVLSMLEMEKTVNSVSDLKGKTIYTTGNGANPQYILEYVLRENGLDPEKDVTIVYKTENTELATVFSEDAEAVVMAPQPVATSIVLNTGAVVSLNMTEEWSKIADDSALMMGCVAIRNEVLAAYPEAVKTFINDYAASIEAANNDPATTGQYCEEYGIVAKAALAAKAIPDCNIVWITGQEMKDGLSGYLNVLFEANPASVGGKLPEDGFYY